MWLGLLEQLRYTQPLDDSAPPTPLSHSLATTTTLTWAKRNTKENNLISTLMLAIDLAMSVNSSHMDTFEIICFEGLVASSLIPSITTTVVQSQTSLNQYVWLFVIKPAFKTSSASISANSKIQAIEQKFLFNRAQPAHSHSSKIVKTHNRKPGIQRQPQTAMHLSNRCGKG